MVVPAATPEFTVTLKTKFVVVVLEARLAIVQITCPVPPIAGTVPQVQPAGGVIEANVVFGGVCW